MYRTRLLPLLLLLACSGTRSAGGPDPKAPWRVALPAADGRTVVLLGRTERPPEALVVVGYRGAVRVPVQEAPVDWLGCAGVEDLAPYRAFILPEPVDQPGVALLGAAAAPDVPKPPANRAELVAAAQERLATVAPADRAQETRLRTLVKVRRPKAPPALVAVGDAGCTGLVALLDATAEAVLAVEQLELPGPTCAPLAGIPPLDLDGDGTLDLVVRSGKGEPQTGLLRAVYALGLDATKASLQNTWKEALSLDCPRLRER